MALQRQRRYSNCTKIEMELLYPAIGAITQFYENGTTWLREYYLFNILVCGVWSEVGPRTKTIIIHMITSSENNRQLWTEAVVKQQSKFNFQLLQLHQRREALCGINLSTFAASDELCTTTDRNYRWRWIAVNRLTSFRMTLRITLSVSVLLELFNSYRGIKLSHQNTFSFPLPPRHRHYNFTYFTHQIITLY